MSAIIDTPKKIEIPETWTRCEVTGLNASSVNKMGQELIFCVGSVRGDTKKGSLTMKRDRAPLGENFPQILQELQKDNPTAEFLFY